MNPKSDEFGVCHETYGLAFVLALAKPGASLVRLGSLHRKSDNPLVGNLVGNNQTLPDQLVATWSF